MRGNVNPHLEEAHELLTPLLGLVGDDGPVGLSLHAPQAHSCLCCSREGADMNHHCGASNGVILQCLTLTCNRCCPFAVVEDGQLPKHVPRGQGAELPSSLGDPELTT